MGEKRKFMEDEMSRFEAEISSSGNGMVSSSNMFVPHQVRPIIGANTYQTVQQKLHSQHPPQQQQQQTQHQSNNLQPNHHQPQHHQPQHHQQQHHHQQHQPPAPSFISTFMPQQAAPMEKSYCSEPTPVVLSSAPKLYLHGPTISLPSNTNPGTDGHSSSQHHSNHHQASSSSSSSAHIDISSLQFDVSQKLKKLKAEKSGPNPIAEAAIQAARASSALQNFQLNEKRKKDKKTVRTAGGQVWEDHSLADWTDDDFRIFCGDLGNDVNDELLTRTFNKYASFIKAKVIRDKRTGKSKGFGFISFKDPTDFSKALKEMDGRYVGSRPIKLRKSSWKSRSFDVVKRKEKEKVQLLQMFNKS